MTQLRLIYSFSLLAAIFVVGTYSLPAEDLAVQLPHIIAEAEGPLESNATTLRQSYFQKKCSPTQSCCRLSQGAPMNQCHCREKVNLFGVSFNCDISLLSGQHYSICPDRMGNGLCPP